MDGAEENATSFEALIINRHQIEQQQNPDISHVDYVILKDGPRVYKVAAHLMIVDRNTGELHHHVVKIETFKKQQGSWKRDDIHSITIDDENEDQIKRLFTFLQAIKRLPESDDKYAIVSATGSGLDINTLFSLLDGLSSSGVAEIIAQMFARTHGNVEGLRAVAERLAHNPAITKEAAAALNIARFINAVSKLEELIIGNAAEREFQALLNENPWMFGSEYSELLQRRDWTRDEQLDFMLRRTADGYLELIEIKTPLNGQPLFLEDKSHGSYYPRQDLSFVIGQVMNYLAKLDASEHTILALDDEIISKIRAKVIIGRDGDGKQAEALRRLNGHLHRIELLTFDQLLRIAKQVVGYLERVIAPVDTDVDLN